MSFQFFNHSRKNSTDSNTTQYLFYICFDCIIATKLCIFTNKILHHSLQSHIVIFIRGIYSQPFIHQEWVIILAISDATEQWPPEKDWSSSSIWSWITLRKWTLRFKFSYQLIVSFLNNFGSSMIRLKSFINQKN